MKLHHTLTTVVFLLITSVSLAQAPPLGTSANFVLFSTNGGVNNTGVSYVTGNVGTNNGSSTGFGNINGAMHDNDLVSALAAADVMVAYNQLNNTVATIFPGPVLGNGQVLNAGVYSIATPATLSLNLTLDGQGDTNAVFIFKIQGSLTTGIASSVNLINGARSCNIFWKVEGAVNMGAATTMHGTIIANNAPINMSAANTLDGRALAINGSISVNSVNVYTPTCGCAMLHGPVPPVLGTTSCYALFSSIGSVTNSGISFATGDIGSNNGTTSGYNPLNVTGTIHPVPDGSTAAAAADLTTVYNYLNVLTHDIELLFPAQFGNGLTLTPHTYLLNAATTLTDTLYLDAIGDSNAVFVIQVNGTFTTTAFSKVILINGTQAQNVFWKIEDDITLGVFSSFSGTIVSQGNITTNPGVVLNGRALTRVGAVNTSDVNVIVPSGGPSFPAPVIISQPVSQTVCVGDSVSFVVAATGTGLTYQWRRGNVNIAGATNDTLTINPVTLADAGNNYNVIVTGSCSASDTSINVSLIINTAAITTQPTNQAVCLGGTVSFTVGATGSGLTYQWRRGNINLTNGINISGVNTNTLTINPALPTDAGNDYNVIVSGATCGGSDTSINVSLTINTVSAITLQPLSQTVCVGDSVSFAIGTTGSGLGFQWTYNNVNITGATNDTLTINPAQLADAGIYNVIVTGTCPANDTSVNVTLVVNPSSSITSQPVSQTVCLGDSVSFVVGTTGSGLTYQWRRGNINLINGINVSGANNDTLTIDPVLLTDAGSNYNVIVTGGGCFGSDTSVNVSLNVNTTAAIVVPPVSVTACAGDSVGFAVVTVGAGLTFQWTKDSVNIAGATSATLTINPVSAGDAGTYNVIVTGGCPGTDTSINVSLIINAPPVILVPPVSQTVCEGDSVNFTVIAVGTGLTYQWTKDGTTISGATNDTLSINTAALADAGTYNVIVTSSGVCSGSDTSANAILVINSPAIINTQPISQTVCLGDSVSFVVGASGTGLVYQWRRGNIILPLTNNDTLTINPVLITDAGNNYNVIVFGGGCLGSDTSINVSLNINTPATILVQPLSETACEGDSVMFTVTATGTGLTYQWTKDSVNISGETNDTLIINPALLPDAGMYNVIVSSSGMCAGNDTSVNASLIINSPAAIVTQPISQTVCLGDSVSFVVDATGTNVTYQWRRGSVIIPLANNDTLTIDPVLVTDTASNYNVIVSSAGCAGSDTSINVSLDIDMPAAILVQPMSQTVCEGDSVIFTVTATGTGLIYEWTNGALSIPGSNNDTLIINPVFASNAGNYGVIVSGGCGDSDTSINAVLTVNPDSTITTEPISQTVCEGDSVSFVVGTSGTGLVYQWRRGNVIIAGANNDTLTINPATTADAGNDYNVIVIGGCSGVDTSVNVSLTINNAASITTQPISQALCESDSVSFTVAATGTGITYQWVMGNTNITGETNDTLTLDSVALTDAGTYYVIVAGACGSDTSAMVNLNVNTTASIQTHPGNQTVCEGDSVSFVVVATGTALTYQWMNGNTAIAGATNDTLTINNVTFADAGANYHVIVFGPCGNDTSVNVSLNVNTASAVSTEPISQTVCEGDSTSLVVIATGTNTTYQWYNGNTAIAGATNDTLTFNPAAVTDGSAFYNVVVSGPCSANDTSLFVSLIVNSPAAVNIQPSSQIACLGDSISFVVGASGTNVTYQWMNGTTTIVGATNDTLTINPVTLTDVSNNYTVIVSSGVCAGSDTSINVALTLDTASVISSQPISQTVCEGDSVSFVIGTTTTTGLTYQWYIGNTMIGGATNDTLTINSVVMADAANNYNVIVTGGCPGSDTSINVSLTINAAPAISTQPVSQTVCEGESASFVAAATGAGVTYQWMNGSTTIAGATGSTFTINPAELTDAGTNYYVIVSGTCSPNDTSALVSLTVNPSPVATASTDSSVCLNSSITLNAQTVAGASYQWTGPNGYSSTSQNAVIGFATIINAGTYNLTVTVDGCTSAASAVTVSVIDCDSLELIFVPEGFSPNGDLINEFFVINGIEDYPGNTFTVFNRWGAKVFEASPYVNTWDGRSSEGINIGDGMLPVGTYFYVLDLGNDTEATKGTIYLNR